jgi:hypothetical protein
MAPPRNNNNNPTGRGGFLAGQTGNAGGRPAVNSKLQIWFLSRAREAGEIVVEIAHNKQATKSDAIRLQACREILDRGMGKAPQSLSLSLERALDTLISRLGERAGMPFPIHPHMCSDTRAALPWRTPATIHGPSKRGSAIAISSTQSVIRG